MPWASAPMCLTSNSKTKYINKDILMTNTNNNKFLSTYNTNENLKFVQISVRIRCYVIRRIQNSIQEKRIVNI